MQSRIKMVECPRDAMQGWKNLIPTDKKIEYLNALLQVGFHTLDFGSFVSAKAIPQMADTSEVIKGLNLDGVTTKLLSIVANYRGAEQASAYEQIEYLGFPFSVSETFQQRNTNASIEDALSRVEQIQDLCIQKNKKLVIYISMGFGNPYGDPYDEDIVFEWVNKLVGLDIGIISLADTVGLATPNQVYEMTSYLVETLPGTEIGVHLHCRPDNWQEKLDAAIRSGTNRIDGALKGIGGCPMANDDLVGNMDTLNIITHLRTQGFVLDIRDEELEKCTNLAEEIFRS